MAANRSFSILEAKDVPNPIETPAYTVVSRHVRMVLFDKQAFLSNVLSVRAYVPSILHIAHARLDATQHYSVRDKVGQWKFSKGSSLIGGTDDDNLCLLRSA